MSFTRMRAGAVPALLVLVLTSATAGAVAYGCIPNPDTSGLPPYDGGGGSDVTINLPETGSQTDGSVDSEASSSTPDVVIDTNPPVATVTGVVIDYTQSNGAGVVTGATVAANGVTTTSGVDGTFTLANVTLPASGPLVIDVSKSVQSNVDGGAGASGVAYSATQVSVNATPGTTVSVFPILHEGCFVTVDTRALSATTATTVNLGQCSNRPGAYAAAGVKSVSFSTVTGVFQGVARIEMVPLAYPADKPQDLSWALGLPGVTSPEDLLGAASFQVFEDSTGAPLSVTPTSSGQPPTLTLTVPLYRQPNGATELPTRASFYDSTSGGWSLDTTVATTASTLDAGSAAIPLIDIGAPSKLGWWALTAATPAARSCITGLIQKGTSPVAGMWVRGAGTNYLGASSALTASDGTFCLDVKTTASGGTGSGQLTLVGGMATAGGSAYVIPKGTVVAVSTQTGGSCTTPNNCSPAGTINLAAAGTCISGVLSSATTGPLDIRLYPNPGPTAAQMASGILSPAYGGQVTPGTGGSVCVNAPSGIQVELDSVAVGGGCFSIPATPSNDAGAVCGGGSCFDAGSIQPCP